MTDYSEFKKIVICPCGWNQLQLTVFNNSGCCPDCGGKISDMKYVIGKYEVTHEVNKFFGFTISTWQRYGKFIPKDELNDT